MKQLNNKTLAIILVVLVAAFVLTKVFRSPHLESNVKTDLFQVDTASVTEVRIYPYKQQGKEIILVRKGREWHAVQGARNVPAAGGVVQDLLNALTDVRVSRMVSRKKSDWDDYAVGDTTGTHVVVYGGADSLANFWIGAAGGGTGPYSQNASYIRMSNSPQVYETAEGYLASYFNKAYDGWRIHTFLRVNTNEVSKIIFQYAADSGFVAEKKGHGWMIGSRPADSAKMADYLSGLRSKDLSAFADNFKAATDPDAMITLKNDSTSLAIVKAWKGKDGWVLSSTLRPGVYFSGKGSDVAKTLLVGKAALIGK